MKILLLILALGFSTPESKVDRQPFSSASDADCNPEETARKIVAGKYQPRNILFHYGKKEILKKDVLAGTVPQNDWDDYIMGEKTTYHLKRFRRGLYGTEYLESADTFGSSTYDGLMEIQIEESCLVPQRIATMFGLARTTMFKKWYESKLFDQNFDVWKKACFERDGSPKINQFEFYRNPESGINSNKESNCEKVVAEFFIEKNFAIIQDNAGDLTRSWAIRDRDCIHKISGSSAFWSKSFSTRSELWKNQCKMNRNHRNNVRIWFKAIAEEGYVSSDLERFSKMIAEVKAPEDKVDWETDETDRFAAQDFANTLSSVGRICEAKGRKKELQEIMYGLAENVDQLQSSDVEITLRSACR